MPPQDHLTARIATAECKPTRSPRVFRVGTMDESITPMFIAAGMPPHCPDGWGGGACLVRSAPPAVQVPCTTPASLPTHRLLPPRGSPYHNRPAQARRICHSSTQESARLPFHHGANVTYAYVDAKTRGCNRRPFRPRCAAVRRRTEELIVHCKAGGRSAEAVRILLAAGFRARSLSGGICAWSTELDPTVPVY
jgi:rhodanese-related sulfurtransferase